VILVILAVVCLLSVPLTGGRLGRLAEVKVRGLWLAPLALVLQIGILSVAPSGDRPLHIAIHYGSYVLVGVFLCANLRIPGVPVIATGALFNALVIVVNGGVMPEWSVARRLAGMAQKSGFRNAAQVAHPHLQWLGDIIPIPGPWPLQNVLSIGDLIIFAGMLLLLHRTCGRASVAPREPVTVDAAL
jgi:hypothetical protein